MTGSAPPRAGSRFLALHLPSLATDRLVLAEPGLAGGAGLATWAFSGRRRVLVAVDGAAAGAGLRPGRALADATAILPGLVLRPADPAGDARALHGLALAARRYTPLAAEDPPDGLALDITGCAHLAGGDGPMLRDALARLGRAGIAARGAVAGALATAAALARARDDDPVIPSGSEEAAVAPLPIGLALRLETPLRDALMRLGLRRVGDLLGQPRGPLARRFGTELLDRLDAAAGRRRAVLRPVVPPPELSAARDFPDPVVTRPGIDAVLDRLLEELCERLRQAGLGARHVALSAWRVDGAVQRVETGTGRAVRSPPHLRRLFAERLGRLEPGLGFERMVLEARETEPMAAGAQAGLGLGGAERADAAGALAELIDRLRQRVPVNRALPVASHWPERSVTALDPHEAGPAPPDGWVGPTRPVLLLRRPVPLEGVIAVGDGPPSVVILNGTAHRLRRAEGPARLEPEWWRSPPAAARRDYYRVELASGPRLWIYRTGPEERPCWMLHGHLP